MAVVVVVVVVVVGDIPMLILGVSSLLVSHWALSPSTVPPEIFHH